MKILYFMIWDYKLLFSRRKKLFLIIVINLIIGFYACLYFFSFYIDNYIDTKQFFQEYKPYDIIYKNITQQDCENIYNIVNRILSSDEFPHISKMELYGIQKDDLNNIHDVVGLSMNDKNYRKFFEVIKGKFFDDCNLNKNSQVAFSVRRPLTSRYDSIKIGSKITLNGRIYTIIGQGYGYRDEVLYISYKDFLETSKGIYKISINFKDRLKPKQLDLLVENCEEIKGYDKIIVPKVNQNKFTELIFRLVIIGGIVCVALLGVMNIFRFLTIINLDKFAVHILCGMSPRERLMLLLCEITFLLSVNYIIAVILYELTLQYIQANSLMLYQYFGGLVVNIIIVSIYVAIKIKTEFNNTIIERL